MGTGILFTAAGWLAAVALGEVAVSCAVRLTAARYPRLHRGDGPPTVPEHGWLLPELSGAACLALLAFLGALPWPAPLLAGALAGILAAVAAIPLLNAAREVAGQKGGLRAAGNLAAFLFLRLPRAGLWFLRDDVRTAARRRGHESPAGPPGQPAARPQGSPPPARAQGAAAAQAAAVREVPPARDDPALAPAPEPAEVAAGLAEANVEIPEPWAQLIYHVASRVAPTSADQERFLYGDAAGFIALCEAYHSGAGNAVDEIGLDPAFGEALLDIGDAVAPVSGDVIQAVRRFRAIYEGIISFAENGGVLPFNTRDFFGGHGGNPPQDGAGEAA